MNQQKDCATCKPSLLERWGLAVLGVTVVIAIAPKLVIAQVNSQLNSQTRQAMIDSIKDEYYSRALYAAVIQKFGEVRPFRNIVQAEDRHVSLWKTLFTQYGLPLPADSFAGKISVPKTLPAACQKGVETEIANVAMYDRFLSFVKQPDLRAAFSQLREVSQERHLRAFQRCASF